MIQRSPPTSSGDWSRPEERQSRNEIHNQLYLSESSPAEASERPFTETQASDEESSRGIVIAPGLCASCIETFDYLPTSDGAFTDGFQREMSDIEVAAKAGCPACAIFQANFGLFEDPRGRKMHGTVARVLLTMNPYFNFVSMLQPLSYTPARYFVRPAKDLEVLMQPIKVGVSTGSEESLECVQQWLRTCTASHASCRPFPTNASYRPTRLLDVSGDTYGGSMTIRPREKAELLELVTHVTLSHCWGSSLPYQLTMQTIAVLKSDGMLPLSQLGRTFQEAIEVTRRLGVSYIWIDCLCIIQDSVEDWERESVLMQDVYGNSYCNIAATASTNSQGGCFRDRNPTILTPLKLKLLGRGGGGSGNIDREGLVVVEEEENEGKDNEKEKEKLKEEHCYFYLTDVELWWERFEKAPLNQRAWVLQERMLAPRVLHFDADQLVWECSELTAYERFPAGMSELIPMQKMLRGRLEAVLGRELRTKPKGRDIYDIWRPIVRAYSASGLTKDWDRLVAIHGVATKVARVLGCRYAAGLLGRNMESQLAWEVADNKKTKWPGVPVAPSWSWASVVGAVSMLPQWDACDGPEQIKEVTLCEVQNRDGLRTSGNTTPIVSREELLVLGWLTPMYYVTHRETQAWTNEENQYELREYDEETEKWFYSQVCEGDEDVWPLANMGHSESTVYHQQYDGGEMSVLVSAAEGFMPDERNHSYIRMNHDVRAEFKTRRQRWLMPVYEISEWEPVDIFDMTEYRAIHGLVLDKVEDENNKKAEARNWQELKFRRCGTFKTTKGCLVNYGQSRFRLLKGALRFDVEGVPVELCDQVLAPSRTANDYEYTISNQVRQYLISIV